MQRRTLLQGLGCASATLWLPTILPQVGKAIEPIARPKPGRLRLALAAYSMRKYLAFAKDGTQAMDMYQYVDYCRSLGIDGAELTSYYFREDVSSDEIAKLKLYCQRTGITISGGAIRNDFCQPDGPALEADMAHTLRWIDRYAELGVAAIRIFAGKLPKGAELTPTLTHCAQKVQQACEYAAKKGVYLALENHGGVTEKAEGLLSIVQQVQSEALGINFDSGNFKSTNDPYAELEQIAPYAVNAQIKVEMTTPEGKKVPADLERIVSILRQAGYSGWVALEYEAAEEPKEAIPEWISKLKKLLDA
jgi:sugar phosphate isomerase/epimerase